MKKKSQTSLIVKLAIVVIVVGAVFFYAKSKRQNAVEYAPCATTANGLTFSVIETGPEMVGSSENAELFIAATEGSKIFAKGNLNYIVDNTGPDELYFSLCNSKVIDGKVTVVENFDPTQDKIKIFCGHDKVTPEQISIIHDEYEGMPITYIQVQGKNDITAIALLGNIDIKVEDIVLNESFMPAAAAPSPSVTENVEVIQQVGE